MKEQEHHQHEHFLTHIAKVMPCCLNSTVGYLIALLAVKGL